MPQLKKVSIEDVAYAAGVSKTLVSLVLNNKWEQYGIKPSTCNKVLEQAHALNYVHQSVKKIANVKRKSIGLIVSDIGNPFYTSIANSINSIAELKGFHLICCSSDEKVDREKQLIQKLCEMGVEGLIVSTAQKEPSEFLRLQEERMPVVLIDRHFHSSPVPAVSTNNYESALMLTQTLLDKGYRNIALMALSPWHISSICERIDGFLHAHESRGADFDVENLMAIPFNNVCESVRAQIEKRKNQDRMPDAIIALNNSLAVTAMECLNDYGIAVPQQLALASFDDLDCYSFMQPAITTVAQSIEKLSQAAFDCLEKIIDEQPLESTLIKIPAEIILRDSTPSKIQVKYQMAYFD